MRRSGPAARVTARLALLGASLAASCLTPPAVLPAADVDYRKMVDELDDLAEPVAIDVGAPAPLRGLFVPAGEGAPVVLHLLESSGSVASVRGGYEPVLRQLADLGVASLIVDYAGVGASAGRRSPHNLERDALAMWAEALARAGNDPDRVVIRGTSLGTLAAALLLAEGIRPGGVVLIAPVLPGSATHRLARHTHGKLVGAMAGLVFAPIAAVDLPERIADCPVPILVVVPEDDIFLTEKDTRRLREATREAGGRWVVRDGGHMVLAAESHFCLADEVLLLRVLFPAGPPREERARRVVSTLPLSLAERFAEGTIELARLISVSSVLAPDRPLHVAAAALSGSEPIDAARIVWLGRDRLPRDLPFESLVDAYSLDDPAGKLPIDWIERAARPQDLFAWRVGFRMMLTPNQFVTMARGVVDENEDSSLSYRVTFDGKFAVEASLDLRRLWEDLLSRGLSPVDARRQFVRVLLKAHHTPERLRMEAGAAPVLEVLWENRWRVLELDDEPQVLGLEAVGPR